MVLTKTPVCDFGRPAIDFDLPDAQGERWSLAKSRGENGLLVMFICNHCPYVKAIQTRLVRDTQALIHAAIGCIAIMPNDVEAYPEDSLENMRKVADRHGYPFPYVIDETQQVAAAYGAVCTPDFFGYNRDLELQYRGRLDSSGKNPEADDTRRELLEAMLAVAHHGRGPQEQSPSMGCSIKWHNDEPPVS
jgi:peroxiredoxin